MILQLQQKIEKEINLNILNYMEKNLEIKNDKNWRYKKTNNSSYNQQAFRNKITMKFNVFFYIGKIGFNNSFIISEILGSITFPFLFLFDIFG